MNDLQPPIVEPDPRFPSGAWTGFFLQMMLPGRHLANIGLKFQNGKMTGKGVDIVGPFTMSGTYDLSNGVCEWNKKYLGKHSVYYRGVNEGAGIWGVWEIRQFGGLYVDVGGFHIWPEGLDISHESERTEQAVLHAMRQSSGRRLLRNLPLYTLVVGGLVLWALAHYGHIFHYLTMK